MSVACKLYEGDFKEKIDKAVGVSDALFEFGTGKCLLPGFFSDIAQQILDAPVRNDDVWLISFPRTGSTWCQEMIWLILHDMDFEGVSNTVQQIRAPLIEMSTVLYEYTDQFKHLFTNSVDFVNNLPSPRCIKSHLPLDLLPKELDTVNPKIIYTMRNPKDLCVSYYYHLKIVHSMDIPFEQFCELFLNGALPLGYLWDHYLPFWAKRNDPNLLILKYEDMKRDSRATIKKIADFLEKPISENDVDNMCDFLSIEKMRENKGCNLQLLVEHKTGDKDYYKNIGTHFIRKGIVGDYKNHMSEDMIVRFDKWTEENTKGTGLSFDN